MFISISNSKLSSRIINTMNINNLNHLIMCCIINISSLSLKNDENSITPMNHRIMTNILYRIMLRSNNILNQLNLRYEELSILPNNNLNHINSSRVQITNYQHLSCLAEVQCHYHLIFLLKMDDYYYYNKILSSNQISHTLKFLSNLIIYLSYAIFISEYGKNGLKCKIHS